MDTQCCLGIRIHFLQLAICTSMEPTLFAKDWEHASELARSDYIIWWFTASHNLLDPSSQGRSACCLGESRESFPVISPRQYKGSGIILFEKNSLLKSGFICDNVTLKTKCGIV